MDGMGNLIPDLDATYELFDRVINVRDGFTVPLGLKGVVIGIPIGQLGNVYVVIFMVNLFSRILRVLVKISISMYGYL